MEDEQHDEQPQMIRAASGARDKGVIGLGAFMENPKKSLLSPAQAYANSSQEYAVEWGKMTQAERDERVRDMEKARAQTRALVNAAKTGRPLALGLAVAVGFLIYAKRNGSLPGFLDSLLNGKNVIRALVVALMAFVYSKRAPKIMNKNPEGVPMSFPIVGMIQGQLQAQDCFNLFFLNQDRKIGFKTWEFNLMENKTGIVLNDPIDRKYFLKDNWRNYLKNVDAPGTVTFQDLFAELMGRGIFSTDKKEWQDHRKVAASMFSVNGLRTQMEHVFKNHTEKLVRLLRTQADTGKTIDLQNIFQCFTFDTICEIAFGVSPNSLDVGVRGEKEAFLLAFDTAQVISSSRMFLPTFQWQLEKSLGIGTEKALLDAASYVNNYIESIIKERRFSADFASREDLLSLYIQFARKSGQTYMEDDTYLRDVILNFMIAGRDTTSCTLTNWFKLIGTSSKGPEVSKRIVEEFNKKHPEGSDITWESTTALRFGDAVFNETLRMYPPVAGDFRIAENDDVLPGSGFKIRKGAFMLISNLSIGRNPNLWDKPDEYNPDRWVQVDPQTGELDPIRRPDELLFPVFWGGARLCLGKDMARFEAKLVASSLMKHFRFEVLPHEEKFVNGPVIFYTKGLPVRIHSAKN